MTLAKFRWPQLNFHVDVDGWGPRYIVTMVDKTRPEHTFWEANGVGCSLDVALNNLREVVEGQFK